MQNLQNMSAPFLPNFSLWLHVPLLQFPHPMKLGLGLLTASPCRLLLDSFYFRPPLFTMFRRSHSALGSTVSRTFCDISAAAYWY